MDHLSEKNDNHDQSQAAESENKDQEIFPEGLRVLAVDDDMVCLRTLQAVLQSCNYKVKVASDGAKALKLLWEEKDNFDIVITDVHMPDMDGFRLLEIVSLEMDIPVVMISANGEKNMVMKGIKHGARDYLLKPIRKEEIQNIWQHVIRKKLYHPNGSVVKNEVPDQNSKSTKRQRLQSKENESNLNNDSGGDNSKHKKQRVIWTPELNKKFIDAVNEIGVDKAVPKKILEHMNEPQVSRDNIASRLQKFRNAIKKNSANDVESTGISGQPSTTTITSPNNQIAMRFTQPDGFEVKGYKNLVSLQHSQFGQKSCLNPNPLSVLPTLNQREILVQPYTQVPEVNQVLQRKHIPRVGYYSSNPLRMDNLHQHRDYNGIKHQCFPPRTTMLDDYMENSSHVPFYNASSTGLGSRNFSLNASASISYPNICFGGSNASSTIPTDASTELSTCVQGQTIGISADIQSFRLEHVDEGDNMMFINHPPDHLETGNFTDEDLHAAIRQFQQ